MVTFTLITKTSKSEASAISSLRCFLTYCAKLGLVTRIQICMRRTEVVCSSLPMGRGAFADNDRRLILHLRDCHLGPSRTGIFNLTFTYHRYRCPSNGRFGTSKRLLRTQGTGRRADDILATHTSVWPHFALTHFTGGPEPCEARGNVADRDDSNGAFIMV